MEKDSLLLSIWYFIEKEASKTPYGRSVIFFVVLVIVTFILVRLFYKNINKDALEAKDEGYKAYRKLSRDLLDTNDKLRVELNELNQQKEFINHQLIIEPNIKQKDILNLKLPLIRIERNFIQLKRLLLLTLINSTRDRGTNIIKTGIFNTYEALSIKIPNEIEPRLITAVLDKHEMQTVNNMALISELLAKIDNIDPSIDQIELPDNVANIARSENDKLLDTDIDFLFQRLKHIVTELNTGKQAN